MVAIVPEIVPEHKLYHNPSERRWGLLTHIFVNYILKAKSNTWNYRLGQVKFPKFLNTPPQNLQMVDLVWASAKKFDFNPSNQPRIGLQHFMWLNLQYKTKKLTRPNFKIPFDYNLLFLVVVHENIVCPTTFIAKTWKFMGTSVY